MNLLRMPEKANTNRTNDTNIIVIQIAQISQIFYFQELEN